jgi:hypothetical protein
MFIIRKFSNTSQRSPIQFTGSFPGVHFVLTVFSPVLKLVLQIMSFKKLIAFVALMMFASQGAMAASKPSVGLRAAMPSPPSTKRKNTEVNVGHING